MMIYIVYTENNIISLNNKFNSIMNFFISMVYVIKRNIVIPTNMPKNLPKLYIFEFSLINMVEVYIRTI